MRPFSILKAILKNENVYKRLFYAKKIKHRATPGIKHQDLFQYVVSSEINKIQQLKGLMRHVCHSLGPVLGYFGVSKI